MVETLNIHENGNCANRVLCARSFSELISEIDYNGEKIIPIVELGKIAGYYPGRYPNVNFDRGTMNPKGAYYISNIKREIETIDKFCAFVFSSDMLAFYYVNSNRKREIVENQILLCQKLREWGFIE